MRVRYKRKDPNEVRDQTTDAGLSPPPPPLHLPGETAAGLADTRTPFPAYTVQDVGGRKNGRDTCGRDRLSSPVAASEFVLARLNVS